MTVTRYQTPGGPAAFVSSGSAEGVTFEAHGTEGFGMAWRTNADSASAIKIALDIFGVPGPSDQGHVLTTEGPQQMPSVAILERLGSIATTASAIHIEINDISLTWSATEANDTSACEGLLSLGTDRFDAEQLEELLLQTASDKLRNDVHAIVFAGRAAMKPYVR